MESDISAKAAKTVSLNTALLVHFSGTGGAARVADAFDRELAQNGIAVSRAALEHGHLPLIGPPPPTTPDIIILVYAVHAFSAPEPVWEWLRALPAGNKTPVAVISVSGGGEGSLNRACRHGAIRLFEKKSRQANPLTASSNH